MKIKRIFALVLAVLMLTLCGCSSPEPQGPEAYDASSAAQVRDTRYLYLTVWSWQIASLEDAHVYAQKALDCGFTAIDFAVLWSAFEPLQGHFDWTYLDGVMKTFSDKGLKVSLQPLLWTKDLSWAEDLSLQETSGRSVYEVEGRGSYLSFTDAETLSVVKNTLQSFALHASTNYGSYLTRWGVRLSCFGEFDYSVNESLDHSGSATRAFYDYLKEVYGTWSALSEARSLGISSREELDAMLLSDVVKACPGDWRRFRQKTLFELLDTVTGIFRSADPSVPILFPLGTCGNVMNTAYSGVVDLWSAIEEHDVDLVGISFCDGSDANMMLSLISSLTTKEISVEVDGAWALEEGRDIASQVKLCGKFGVFSVSTANFTLEQLDTHKEILSSYLGLFNVDETMGDADPAKAILICSNALAESDPPRSYDSLYRDVWATLSENGARRVRFVTEAQLSSDASLEGVTDLYAGNINGSVQVSQAWVDAFLKAEASLYSNGDLSFVLLDGAALPEETATALTGRIKGN